MSATMCVSFFSLELVAVLPIRKKKQLDIGGHDIRQGVLEGPARIDASLHVLDEFLGDVYDTFFSIAHERECPRGMSFAGGAMTGRFPATAMPQHQRAREEISRHGKSAQGVVLAFAPLCGCGSFRSSLHLTPIIR